MLSKMRKLQLRFIIVKLKTRSLVIYKGRIIRLVSYFSLATVVPTTGFFRLC